MDSSAPTAFHPSPPSPALSPQSIRALSSSQGDDGVVVENEPQLTKQKPRVALASAFLRGLLLVKVDDGEEEKRVLLVNDLVGGVKGGAAAPVARRQDCCTDRDLARVILPSDRWEGEEAALVVVGELIQ